MSILPIIPIAACAILVAPMVAQDKERKQKPAANPLVVLVNAKNKVNSLSRADLVKYLKLSKKRWPDNSKVLVVLPKSKDPAMKELLAKIYKMDARSLKKHWARMLYQNRITARPKSWDPVRAAAFVAGKERGMAVMLLDQVPKTKGIKILKVDGKAPTDKAYPIL